MKPRWYQQEAIDTTLDFIGKDKRNPLIVAPTGSGKSLIIAHIARQLVDNGHRVLIVSHVGEIISQNYEAVVRCIPKSIVGIYAASLDRKERKRVTVCSIQSIFRKVKLFSSYTYIIVDEAHSIPKSNGGMYYKLIIELKATVIGLTASPFRSDSGLLCEGKDRIFDLIIYDIDIIRLIKEKFLSPLVTNATQNKLDVKGVKTIAGDFSSKSLSEKLDRNGISNKVIDEVISYKDNYKTWLIFAIDIAHAEHITTCLLDKGIKVAVVHSKQSSVINKSNIASLRDNSIQGLVSVCTLTTGFDCPCIDLIVLLRPTQSPVLHIQMIGRGLRISPNKKHCLILDFAGNILRLGPINNVVIKDKKAGEKAEPLLKVCKNCFSHVPLKAKNCYMCGFELYVAGENKNTGITLVPSKLKAIDNLTEDDWRVVTRVTYESYVSLNNILSMKVSYYLNQNVVYDYVNPFGNSFINYNWKSWWNYRTNVPLPDSIANMVRLSTELAIPVSIKLSYKGKYPKITDAVFKC